jgi:hypothetical protein
MKVCARKQSRLVHQIHCAAVMRTPQQMHGTRTSPTLLTTLVFGMRYLRYEAWLTDVMSTP